MGESGSSCIRSNDPAPVVGKLTSWARSHGER